MPWPTGVFLFVASMSQGDAQNVFPLAKGNTWRYEITYFNSTPIVTVPYTFRIVRDTVMPNGKLYYVLDSADMFWERFVRSDSSRVYYWDNSGPNNTWVEHTAFNLQAVTGEVDTVNLAGFFTAGVSGVATDSIFGKLTSVRFFGLGGLIFAGLRVANGFGYLRYEYWADSPDLQYFWSLSGCIISGTIYGVMTDVKHLPEAPVLAELLQNYPNPFNPTTTIHYALPQRAHVMLNVFNTLGQKVATLVDAAEEPGEHSVRFDGTGLASGVYVYRLRAGDFVQSRTMVFVK